MSQKIEAVELTEWEIKRNAEQEIWEREKGQPAEKKLRAVAAALGFEVVEDERDQVNRWRSQITIRAQKEDMTIYLNAYGYHMNNRAGISGGLPRAKRGEASTYGIEVPSITFSVEKTAEQMLKDIRGRFFPGYLVAMDEMREQIKYTEAYMDNRTAAIEKIKGKKATPEESKDGKCRLEFGDVYGYLKASRNDVSLELVSLPVDLAVKVVEMLRKEVK